jgi:signal transduction histidine kinase
MNMKYLRYVIVFSLFTILATVGLQFYWNAKNYEFQKKQLQQEVELLFQQSATRYFDETSKADVIAFLSKSPVIETKEFISKLRLDTVFEKKNQRYKKWNFKTLDTVFLSTKNDVSPKKIIYMRVDSLAKSNFYLNDIDSGKIKSGKTVFSADVTSFNNSLKNSKDISELQHISDSIRESVSLLVVRGKKTLDSLGDLSVFANRMVISMTRDSLDYQAIDSLFRNAISERNLNVPFKFRHQLGDSLFFQTSELIFPNSLALSSSFLKSGETFFIDYDVPNREVLARMSKELVLSFLLSFSVWFCLFFMWKIIQKQKQIDTIKNDFISNITHEFKTPITTISTALEAMTTFNVENTMERVYKYAKVSNEQLQKLTILVERILETSVLQADELPIQMEEVALHEILPLWLEKFSQNPDVTVRTHISEREITINSDTLHLEQILNNLVDNAIKYGGNRVEVKLYQTAKSIVIDVIDCGKGIPKNEQTRIFEKFYRIPQGNIHDVKGFGIGLYYAKTVAKRLGAKLNYVGGLPSTFRLEWYA